MIVVRVTVSTMASKARGSQNCWRVGERARPGVQPCRGSRRPRAHQIAAGGTTGAGVAPVAPEHRQGRVWFLPHAAPERPPGAPVSPAPTSLPAASGPVASVGDGPRHLCHVGEFGAEQRPPQRFGTTSTSPEEKNRTLPETVREVARFCSAKMARNFERSFIGGGHEHHGAAHHVSDGAFQKRIMRASQKQGIHSRSVTGRARGFSSAKTVS